MSELLRTGGPMIAVILGVSALAWALVGWTWLRLRAEAGEGFARAEAGARALEAHRRPTPCAEGPRAEGTLAEQLVAAAGDARGGQEALARRLAPLLAREGAALERPLRPIAALAAALPLLGLLGTVLGMISAFETIAQVGTGDARVVASGIFEALVTTAGGLLIGVAAMAFHTHLARRAEQLTMRIEDVATALVELPEQAGERAPEQPAASPAPRLAEAH